MPDEKRYTERDLILAKREGYIRRMLATTYTSDAEVVHAAARREFPLPPQTRPRVVRSGIFGMEWRMRDGVLEFRETGAVLWVRHNHTAAILDVLANPTEPVPDEEG